MITTRTNGKRTAAPLKEAADPLERRIQELSQQPSLAGLKKSSCKVMGRIVKRYEQIASTSFETVDLSHKERLQLAYFIETKIASLQKVATQVFAKGHEGNARALQVDAEEGIVYLLADHEISKITGSGTFKELGLGLRLPFKDFKKKPELVAHLITKIDRDELRVMTKAALRKEIVEIQEDVEKVEKELSYYRRLRATKGLATFYTSTKYNEVIGGENVPRISMIFKLATGGDLGALVKKRALQQDEERDFMTQLVAFLKELHKSGVVHADIKAENVLLYEDNVTGVADFGLAFDKKKKGKSTPSYMFRLGYYGTEKYTAPELFGNLEFTKGGDYLKTDVWALGCLLYELHFKKEAPGHLLIEEHDKTNYDNDKLKFKDAQVLAKAQAAFKKEVQEVVEKPLAALLKKKKLSAKEGLELQIYHMLRLDPGKRKL